MKLEEILEFLSEDSKLKCKICNQELSNTDGSCLFEQRFGIGLSYHIECAENLIECVLKLPEELREKIKLEIILKRYELVSHNRELEKIIKKKAIELDYYHHGSFQFDDKCNKNDKDAYPDVYRVMKEYIFNDTETELIKKSQKPQEPAF